MRRTGSTQKPLLPSSTTSRQPGHVARDQRPAHRRPFQQAARQAFAIGGQDNAVGGRDRAAHIVRRSKVGRSMPSAAQRSTCPRVTADGLSTPHSPSMRKSASARTSATSRAASTNSRTPLSHSSRPMKQERPVGLRRAVAPERNARGRSRSRAPGALARRLTSRRSRNRSRSSSFWKNTACARARPDR